MAATLAAFAVVLAATTGLLEAWTAEALVDEATGCRLLLSTRELGAGRRQAYLRAPVS